MCSYSMLHIYVYIYVCIGSWDSAVCIATGYRLDDQGVRVRVPAGAKIFSSPQRPDRLWGPPSLLSNGYRELLHRGGGGVKAAGP
jgi:hypothetical protein